MVVLPDHIIGIGCHGASTRCDTVLHWAAQSGPTGAATILDERSRNCGFFGRPFPVSFPPWVGGEHLSGLQQELCVPPSVLDSLSTWLATQCDQIKVLLQQFLLPALS